MPTARPPYWIPFWLSMHNCRHTKQETAGNIITVDGTTLGIPAIIAAARYPWVTKLRDGTAQIVLSSDHTIRECVEKSREVIDSKVKAGDTIYGVTTGIGGSAHTRSADHRSLSLAITEVLHIGVLPTDLYRAESDPNEKALSALKAMPPHWVRGALLIRANSLIRGHSGVRWRLIEAILDLLNKNITPVCVLHVPSFHPLTEAQLVPVRGSISASGDLSPLSYVVGALIGDPNILVHSPVHSDQRPASESRATHIMPSATSLALHGLEPIMLAPKEALGVMNGTSFSAGIAALVIFQSIDAVILSEVCTAMGTEALLGTQANYDNFISKVRPHPGQIEASATIDYLLESSSLASSASQTSTSEAVVPQDRYSLRTAPQWIGPLLEDIMSAIHTTEIECNSTTDNPLVNPDTKQIHNGGNFQALALTMAFEKIRLALFLLGKLLFAQATEMFNPGYNNGLPPNLAATDPSLNFNSKGLEVAMTSYVSELGWLASNVATHVQSAEMHNQAINSLALISGRATVKALEVLNMLISSYLYAVCQALDLRAMQKHLNDSLEAMLSDELRTHFAKNFHDGTVPSSLKAQLVSSVFASLDKTSTLNATPRFEAVASATLPLFLDFYSSCNSSLVVGEHEILRSVSAFHSSFATRGAELLQSLRHSFLSSSKPAESALGYSPGAPAGPFLGRTRPIYEYIRKTLGIQMHGLVHWNKFTDELHREPSAGYNISVIYEAIADERLGTVVAEVFRQHPVQWPSVGGKAKL